MKRILIIASLFGIALGISSCKKNLDLNPASGVTVDGYFKNQKDITAGLAGIYSAFQESMTGAGNTNDEGYGGKYHYWGDLRAETFLASTFTNNSVIEMSTNTLQFSNSSTDWAGLYRVISRTNLAIKYFPQVPASDPNVTPTILNNAMAQAYALRAESYFYIVRNWGDAPLWIEPYLDITQSGSKEKTKALTLIDSLIIPDLQNAYAMISKNQTPTVWYISEAAICAILADVYMWRANIPSGGGGGTADYTKALTWYNTLLTRKTPSGSLYNATTASTPAGAIGALEQGVNWKNNFLTPANASEPIWSIYWDYTVNGCACIPVFVGLSNNPVQLDPVFHAAFKAKYKTDVRVSRSIDTLTTLNHINMLYKYYNLTPTTAGITPVAGNLNFNVYLPMYRLADVYLSMAEAYAMTSDLPNALKYLNYVYVRARQTTATTVVTPIPATAYPSTALMVDGILAEEQFELLGEGKRWYDLVRMNRVHQVMDPVLNIRNATSVTVGNVTTVTPDTKGFIDAPNRYLWPVSQNALNANKKLVQNPGY
ncbi:MAG: RagB/SusD family nutrient uptake outer membrane protein [Mucilaginibacter sp.]|uniref:RagB/SusD family nutrient uptake outer membrane protein n=1 Tax=Mucilaginibacter sp. TaxID=1882438 RepID=UPI00326594CB